jgi:fumarate reductase iron-sulfur subunit
MGADLNKIEILTRREIEARIAAPLIKAFVNEFGKERTLKIAESVIRSLAEESGAQLAKVVGGNTIEHFAKTMPLWSKNDALQFDILEQSDKKFSMNVTKCRYAEMYKELGIQDLGYTLSCARDFAMVEGFNPKIELKRKQTIMEGADYCDFRLTLREA